MANHSTGVRGRGWRGLAVAAVLAVAASLSCRTPSAPYDVTVVSHDIPPGIVGISVPAGKVEVDQNVTVSATVVDRRTPPGQLSYAWRAKTGQISGSGPTVTWRLPKGQSATPRDVSLQLKVTEAYQGTDPSGATFAGDSTASRNSPAFRVHDSPGELGTMAVTFLVQYFGNSSVPPEACLVDFSDSCPGKNDERMDIEANRKNFVILSASASVTSVTFDAGMTFANILAPCTFRSREIATGKVGTVTGDCVLTGVYEQRRWWLCDSHFINGKVIEGSVNDLVRRFFRGGGKGGGQ